MATAAKPFSYEEWLDLSRNDEGREECVNGVIETMPPARWKHAVIVDRLEKQLWNKLDKGATFVVCSDFGLVIRTNPLTRRTPDIAVFLRSSLVERDGYIHSAPELAVEVLSSAGKLDDYASVGIPEVWVIDPDGQTIALHRLENDRYETSQLSHNGVTCPVRFPSIMVDFSLIWQ